MLFRSSGRAVAWRTDTSRSFASEADRSALGAWRAHSLLVLVLGEGARLTTLGIVIGLTAALVAGRLMESLLFGIAPTDPLTFVINASIVTAIALLATFLPALRAARIQRRYGVQVDPP